MRSMEVLRTPDDRFTALPGYPFVPHYAEVDGLRIHYVDEGPRESAPVLMLHGEPSWGFLYRKMIPIIVEAGYRAIAPDFVGFGRSDKPARAEDYTYQRHVDWIRGLVDSLDLSEITLVCQDWGGLIGLRLAAEHLDRFARIVAANTGLPTGDIRMPDIWYAFREAVQKAPVLDIARLVQAGCHTKLSSSILAAYDAPFPEEHFKLGVRTFPMLVPVEPDDPAAEPNRRAWDVLRQWTKPFLTAFSDGDPITRGGELLLQGQIPGTSGQPHTTIEGAGHFLQEDKGEQLAAVVVDFITRSI
jgi:haloalkane dehalogenase